MAAIRRELRRMEQLRASARCGRIRARLPRYAFLAAMLVLCGVGIKAIMAPAGHSSAEAEAKAPVDYAAESFATEFARAYLSYDATRPKEHEASLSRFASSSLELGVGFTPPGSGAQRVNWTEVAQVQHSLAGGLLITVTAGLDSQTDPVYLSVPLKRGQDGAIFLAGYPSFVGPPLSARPNVLDANREAVGDGELTRLVGRVLRNYLSGDVEDLAADLAPAATVTLPTNPLRLTSLEELNWVRGENSGAVLATLGAADPRGGHYTLRYEVGVRAVLAADPRIAPGWRVTYVQAISQEP